MQKTISMEIEEWAYEGQQENFQTLKLTTLIFIFSLYCYVRGWNKADIA